MASRSDDRSAIPDLSGVLSQLSTDHINDEAALGLAAQSPSSVNRARKAASLRLAQDGVLPHVTVGNFPDTKEV